ncbi:hypothetical protein [Ruminococcus sp.]|uniref:hypothetical protein n=1 Tax=Ruminococcus sp. TaxID=41978 RepID=UPI0025D93713|nr:hypothetical protein [Ruminococcus sp.]MBQ8965883.1 hypothetical protein [Ruminococcus sp.]
MNNARRKKLRALADQLGEIMTELEILKGEEETYFYNIPENLQGSERYEAAESAIDSLDTACDDLDEAISSIEEACE